MKAPLFEFPSYQYEIKDWEFKKKGLLNRIIKSKFCVNRRFMLLTRGNVSTKLVNLKENVPFPVKQAQTTLSSFAYMAIRGE